jgi:hypothetical protein
MTRSISRKPEKLKKKNKTKRTKPAGNQQETGRNDVRLRGENEDGDTRLGTTTIMITSIGLGY